MLQMLLESRRRHDLQAGPAKMVESSLKHDGRGWKSAKAPSATLALTQVMEHHWKKRLAARADVAAASATLAMPEETESAYDRMRARKMAYLLLKGVRASVAAKLVETQAMDSLATLAKQRGIAAVDVATGGALFRRKSFKRYALRRRSIGVAEAEANAAKCQRAEDQCELAEAADTVDLSEETPKAHDSQASHVNHAAADNVDTNSDEKPTALDSTYLRKRLRRKASLIDRHRHRSMPAGESAVSSGVCRKTRRPTLKAIKRMRKWVKNCLGKEALKRQRSS